MVNYEEFISRSIFSEPGVCDNPTDSKEWARFCFFVSGKLLSEIRKKRFDINTFNIGSKEDGSPFTNFEKDIEVFCKKELSKFYPKANFIGEESSSSFEIRDDSYSFVIDPIDGTTAFLSAFDTYSFTITVLKGKIPQFSLIGNPSTGDIAFRIGNEKSQIVSFSTLKNKLDVRSLPIVKTSKSDPILTNIHPSISAKKYIDKLYSLWETRIISLVKSVSGSPAWLIVEACKGSSVYFNTWKGGITMPFDLVSAFHILEGAGGMALNINGGGGVDPWNIEGAFIVGRNYDTLKLIIDNL